MVLVAHDRGTVYDDVLLHPFRRVVEPGTASRARARLRAETGAPTVTIVRKDKRETKTILVIDDEEVMRDSCTQVLSREGYSIATAYDGEGGVSLVRTAHPDLVLLDIKLPGRSGVEILREINAIDSTIVIVVITGYATIDTAVEAMKFGASDFLPKPFTPDELRLIVNRGMEKRGLLLQTRTLQEENWRIRENFVSIITHEMRSPLVAVEEYIEVLLGGISGRLEEKQVAILSRCKCRIMWLLSLVNEWLSMARIQETTILENLETVDIRAILSEAFNLVNVQAEEKDIAATFEIPVEIPAITGNGTALVHLFMNLYSNAIKYNRKSGAIATKVCDKGDALSISVSDTGIGIPKESLPFIFDEFFRVRTARKEKTAMETGTGLGLAIAKRIVDGHKGYISVESTPGIGTSFTVHLPKKQDTSAEQEGKDKV